jgi:polyisoprenyl-teichoic acid--peptidoglycan teichoic acid transferase
MRPENPPERWQNPAAPNWDERWRQGGQEPQIPGEIGWRQANSPQGQPAQSPYGGWSPNQANAPVPSGPNAAGSRPGGQSFKPPARGAGPGAPPRPLTRREYLRRRNRRLRWIFIPTAILTVLAATAGGLVLYFGPLLQLIQSSTDHQIARSSQEQGINVPKDILSGQRVNVLLLGSDNDTVKFAGGNGMPGNGVLTQTIIVVSLDPATKTIDLISIPRDSWVNMPGQNSCMKLDEIAGVGNSSDQAIQFERTVVERDYGIPIWRYAWVGLGGFIKVIDTLGGVDVDVLHPIIDDAYPNDVGNGNNQYDYKRLYIPAGPQHLDGTTALEYVRSRHSDLTGDFGRSQRQQSVLIALEKKANTGNLIGRIPDLAKDLQGNVLTDMTVTEITEVANFAKGVSHQNMKQIVLQPPDYSTGQGTLYRPDGEQTYALLPNWQAINQTIQSTVHPDPTINQNQPCSVNPVPGQWSGQTTG